MTEKQTHKSTDETQRPSAESLGELREGRREVTPLTLEQAEKRHKSSQLEREALSKAEELAKEADNAKEKAVIEAKPKQKLRGAPSKKQLKESFNTEMKNIRAEMSLGERLLSSVLHSRPVEKSSDFIGTTLARPNALLSGSIAAFACITLLYFIARHYGYRLSGFETVAAFALGWVIGILYDYIANIVRRRKR